MKTEDLIDSLSSDLKPVKPLENIYVFASKGSLASILVIAIVLYGFGLRSDVWSNLISGAGLQQFLVFGALLFSSLLLGAWWSVPGRPKSSVLLTLVCASLLALGFVNLILVLGMTPMDLLRGPDRESFNCAILTSLTGGVCGMFFILKSRRGAFTRPVFGGVVLALAALGAGGLAITLHCGSDQGMHVFVGHFLLPLLVISVSGLIAGRLFLRW